MFPFCGDWTDDERLIDDISDNDDQFPASRRMSQFEIEFGAMPLRQGVIGSLAHYSQGGEDYKHHITSDRRGFQTDSAVNHLAGAFISNSLIKKDWKTSKFHISPIDSVQCTDTITCGNMSAMSSDLRHIIDEAKDRGFRVDRTSSGHLQLFSPNGRDIVTASGTPSDWRARKNLVAQLKRAYKNLGDDEMQANGNGHSYRSLSVAALIRDTLKNRQVHEATTDEILEAVALQRPNTSRQSIQSTLSQMKSDGVVISPARGVYKLKPPAKLTSGIHGLLFPPKATPLPEPPIDQPASSAEPTPPTPAAPPPAPATSLAAVTLASFNDPEIDSAFTDLLGAMVRLEQLVRNRQAAIETLNKFRALLPPMPPAG